MSIELDLIFESGDGTVKVKTSVLPSSPMDLAWFLKAHMSFVRVTTVSDGTVELSNDEGHVYLPTSPSLHRSFKTIFRLGDYGDRMYAMTVVVSVKSLQRYFGMDESEE